MVGKNSANRKRDLKALWIIGEDVVQTDPNTKKVIKAMESLELLVVQELFMTETAMRATVILPGASFLEKGNIYINFVVESWGIEKSMNVAFLESKKSCFVFITHPSKC